jgi:hypothetical protein
VGTSDGTIEGASEGAREGASEGAREGTSEGAREGTSEGAKEGASDGVKDGESTTSETVISSSGAGAGTGAGVVTSRLPLSPILAADTELVLLSRVRATGRRITNNKPKATRGTITIFFLYQLIFLEFECATFSSRWY